MADELTARLALFFKAAITRSWDGGDMDGGDIQDTAERLKLIKKVPYDPNVHSDSYGECDPGEDWFVVADDVRGVLGAAGGQP